MQRQCSLNYCSRPHRALGYCRIHYRRSREGLQMDAPTTSDPLAVKIEHRINKGHPGECWEWTGHRDPAGYGRVRRGGRGCNMTAAHRVVYEIYVGTIPEGLVIDHLCRNKGCVNPDHLEPVTTRENVLRGVGPTAVNAVKTHCIRGHEFTFENTYRYIKAGRPYRNCKTCKSDRQRARVRTQRMEVASA